MLTTQINPTLLRTSVQKNPALQIAQQLASSSHSSPSIKPDAVRFSGLHLSLSPEEAKVKKIIDFASQYQPRQVDGYQVHNEFFEPFSKLPTNQELRKLLDDLSNRGSFSVITNPKTGLIQTSDTENTEMTRQWFTDSCMTGYLQRKTDPDGWQKSMITNAAALNNPAAKEAFEKTVKNPNWYRKGGVMDGVFHIYLPKTVQVDSEGIPIAQNIKLDHEWFNQKRLESQSLMLTNLIDTVRAGFLPGKEKAWGFKPEILNTKAGQYVVNSISDLGRYLLAVNTNPKTGHFNFKTPSASSWEEAPFKKGMTSDTASAILAIQRLQKLLYRDKTNSALQAVRNAVLDRAPELTEQKLQSFIEAGRSFIEERVTHPLAHKFAPTQTPARPLDTSLLLLAASPYRFQPTDLLADAKTRLNLVIQTKKALLGDHGIRRYNEFILDGTRLHDSYLNQAYHFPDELRKKHLKQDSSQSKAYGSTDASSIEALKDRQSLSKPEYAAQWGLGLSASLQALAKAKLDTLKVAQKEGQQSPEIQRLLKAIDHETVDILNRNIAAIPGPLKARQDIIRSDGTKVKPYLPMEAFEAVPDKTGNMKFIPGAHTLPWHAAQLYDGLQKLARAQKIQESTLSS